MFGGLRVGGLVWRVHERYRVVLLEKLSHICMCINIIYTYIHKTLCMHIYICIHACTYMYTYIYVFV